MNLTAEQLTKLINVVCEGVDRSYLGPLKIQTGLPEHSVIAYNPTAVAMVQAVVGSVVPKGAMRVENTIVKDQEPWQE